MSADIIDESDCVFRLLIPDWVIKGRVSSAAFNCRIPVSMFVKQKLPGHDGQVLHKGKFTDWGRARLMVKNLRSVTRRSDGNLYGLDVKPQRPALPPLEEFSDAHVVLVGPYNNRKAAQALAIEWNEEGKIEKFPLKGN